VPLLLDRRGERGALEELPYQGAPQVAALVQVTPPVLRDGPEQRQAPASWAGALARKVGLTPVYLDVAGVRQRSPREPRLPAAAAAAVLEAVAEEGMRFAPVYPLGVPAVAAAVARAAADQRLGAALRVAVDGLILPSGRALPEVVVDGLERLGLDPDEVDLVVDLGYLDPNFDLDAASAGRILDPLAAIARWRSVVLAAGSVPGTLSAIVGDGQFGGIRRLEWGLWHDLRANRPWLRFGDYGVQNPVPPDPGRAPLMRASIRYTADDFVLAVRGVGPVLKMPRADKETEYRRLARLVAEHPSFAHCCSADQFILDCAEGREAVRAQQIWRRVSTLHHLSVVARQIQSVVLPPPERAHVGAASAGRRTELRQPERVKTPAADL
jgi:hypothetical protein